MNAQQHHRHDESTRKRLDSTTAFMLLMFALILLIFAIELWVPHGHTD